MKNTQSQREEHVSQFLQSFRIQKVFGEVSGYDESADLSTSKNMALESMNPFDENLAVGQIRLLSQTERITYVALIKRWEEDSFLVMAFSHYDDPATDEEFKPEYDGGLYLNTLQAWNTRTLLDETLKESWLIGALPEQDLKDAWAMWERLITGRQLEERLLAKTGLPVMEKDDPRLEYIQEEMDNFAALDQQGLEDFEDEDEEGFDWLKPAPYPSIWAQPEGVSLAAGDEEQNQLATCCLAGHEEIFTFDYAPKEAALRLKIWTADGEERSLAFDGWKLVAGAGKILGEVAQGRCVVRELKEFNGECALMDTEGEVHAFDDYQEA